MRPEILTTVSSCSEFQSLVFFLFEEDWSQEWQAEQFLASDANWLRDEASSQGFLGKRDQCVLISAVTDYPCRKVILIGCGKKDGYSLFDFRKSVAECARQAAKSGLRSLVYVVKAGLFPGSLSDLGTCVRHGYESSVLAGYRFSRHKSTKDVDKGSLEKLGFLLRESDPLSFEPGESFLQSVWKCRDWVNEPAGSLTPLALAEETRQFLSDSGVAVKVLAVDELEKERMGMLLAVGKGSEAPPCLIHCAYQPKYVKKRVVLVGKGITFDSGGYSLKPSDGMKDMKGDMAGAAAVLASMKAIATRELPIEVHAIAPCAENMVSGRAYRLGDVLVSRAGKTVEVTNTDAEGRLILGDALDFAVGLKPDVIIDFATLTGACVVALGPYIAGVMGTDKKLIEIWLSAAERAGEQMWPLPLPSELKDQLNSDVADFRNAGDRWGGALIAGLFLKEFVAGIPWLHVDIAGPAFSDKQHGEFSKGGTGFGIATILEFLSTYSEA